MRLEVITAIPPEEIREIARKSGAEVNLEFGNAEPFHGMPRYRVVVEGREEDIRKFMEKLRLARAGG